MMISKLLPLGFALLLLAAGPAVAEDPARIDSPAQALAEPLPVAAADETPAEAQAMPPSAEMAAGTPVEVPAEMAAGTTPAEAPSETLEEMQGEMLDELAEEALAAMPAALDEVAPGVDEGAGTPLREASPPVPPAAPVLGMVGYDSQGRAGRLHQVARGDTLWDISDAYLGTPWVWPSIWQDNKNIENPHLIHPGDLIWITPWEMRKVTAEEADALLAGGPAAPEPEVFVVPVEKPEPVAVVAPPVTVVQPERPTLRVSDRERVGLVTSEVVEASASIVSAVARRVMLSQGDDVWIGLGEDVVEVGDEFTIFRVQEKVYDPETNRMLGYHVNILGWLVVTKVNPESASAVIRESVLDIEISDRIMPRARPAPEIALQASPGDIRGQISFLAEKRTLMGSMEYVYLNRGTLDGIEVGSPLQVYRESFVARESARNETVDIPERVIADLVVVKAEPEVSVALIRHTKEELAMGDFFRGARP